MEPLLRMRGVTKSFPSSTGPRTVLRDVNLEVARGEFVVIVGFSGSGKTTLISLLAGLIKPDAGEILLDGKPIGEPGPDRGVVFQNYSLLPWLTVFDNILLAVKQVFPEKTVAQQKEHVERHLRMVHLTHARDRRPAQLSGGMRQRTALARALAMNPEMLLMDEPLGALDALTRGGLQKEIEQIWREDRKTVVLITNHIDEAVLLADRIIPLTPGPGATLGPSFAVDLPRPRDPAVVSRLSEFQHLRTEVSEYLLRLRRKGGAVKAPPSVVPARLPEAASITLESLPVEALTPTGRP